MISSKYFKMGQLVATPRINHVMNTDDRFAAEVCLSLKRYAVKDWGDLETDDCQVNEDALQNPDDLYLLGSYQTSRGRIWIITNRISENPGDNATTVLFPEER